MFRYTLPLLAVAALPAIAQDGVVLTFEGVGDPVQMTPDDVAEVQTAQDGDRHVLLIDMKREAMAAFADLTEATVGQEMTVSFCGESLMSPVVQERIGSGKLLLPMPDAEYAAGAAEVLRGRGACDADAE